MPDGSTPVENYGASTCTRSYTSVAGFFSQDSPTASEIQAIPPRFGLLDDSTDRWNRFFAEIDKLNKSANNNASFKVLFFGRHGQGFHNVAEAKYGTKAWDDYWSKLNGDGELVWGPDPELTAIGENQALDACNAWTVEVAHGLPLPEKFYCSPMTRALKTCELTFSNLWTDKSKSLTVLENCREENGIHTCDKRRTASYIVKIFPEFQLEPGFSEEDLLWDPDTRETKAHIAERAKLVLDYIFDHDKETLISITAHGGIINGFLASIGRPAYALPTGGILPVVIKSVHNGAGQATN